MAREYAVANRAGTAGTWAGVTLPFPPGNGRILLPGGSTGLLHVRMCGFEGGYLPLNYPGVYTTDISGCMAIAVLGHATGRQGPFKCFYFTHILAGQFDSKQAKRFIGKPDQAWAVIATNYASSNFGVAELKALDVPEDHISVYRMNSTGSTTFGIRFENGAWGETA